MIDRDQFEKVMGFIAERCAKPPNASQLAMYYRELSPRLSTEEFVEAARGVWGTAEFFPPPIAFMAVRVEAEWERLQRALKLHTPPQVQPGFMDAWNALDPTTQRLVGKMGGLSQFREKVYQRDPIRAMDRFRDEFVRVVATEISEGVMLKELDNRERQRLGDGM